MKLLLWTAGWLLLALILGLIFGCANVTVLPADPNWRANYITCIDDQSKKGNCVYDERTGDCTPVYIYCNWSEVAHQYRAAAVVKPLVDKWNAMADDKP